MGAVAMRASVSSFPHCGLKESVFVSLRTDGQIRFDSRLFDLIVQCRGAIVDRRMYDAQAAYNQAATGSGCTDRQTSFARPGEHFTVSVRIKGEYS